MINTDGLTEEQIAKLEVKADKMREKNKPVQYGRAYLPEPKE